LSPLDREDIFNLSLHVDEMIDYALTTLEEMVLLRVQADDHLRTMVSLVRQEAEELTMAMHRLSSNPRVAGDHARRAKRLENEVDHLYRVAVSDLFTKPKDFKEMMAYAPPPRGLPPHLKYVRPGRRSGQPIWNGSNEVNVGRLMKIQAVFFDMGGNIETYDYTRELRLQATVELHKLLKEAGINLDLSIEQLYNVVEAGQARYHRWRKETLVELPPERIWSEYILAITRLTGNN
jgi:hypothetical protein